MLKVIKKLLERNAIFISILLTVSIAFLSLTSSHAIEVPIDNSDKLFHCLAYFFLTSSWFFAIKKSHNNYRVKTTIMILVVVFGILLEVLQGTMTTYRTMDLFDIVSNSLGVVLSFFSFNFLLKSFKAI